MLEDDIHNNTITAANSDSTVDNCIFCNLIANNDQNIILEPRVRLLSLIKINLISDYIV